MHPALQRLFPQLHPAAFMFLGFFVSDNFHHTLSCWNIPVLILDSCVLEYFCAGPCGLWAARKQGEIGLTFFLLQTSIFNGL